MAKNLVNGTNIVIEESGDNISMDLSSTYNTNLQQEINDSFKENNIYFTTETVIGTWIDGKPIYRKVIANEVDMVNGSEISLSSISNMSSLVSIQSKELKVSDNVVFYNNYYDSSTNKFNLFHYIANNSLYLYAGSNTHYTTTVIIEYTKTTD